MFFREVAKGKPGKKGAPDASYRQRRRSNSGTEGSAKGSMFTAKREVPSHFTVHPEWASEVAGQPRRK